MNRFKFMKLLGDGSYGTVTKAQNTETGELVAVKKIKQKFTSWDECVNLREVKALKKLSHLNIVQLIELVRQGQDLYFIFELLEGNIYQKMKYPEKPFTEERIKNVIYQTLSGLNYMHTNGLFHRDIKPENLLVNGDTLKIADLGLAREIRSLPPYTEYISTRWYRAPEVLLRCRHYSSPIDIWAVGCITAEMFNKSPLFAGTSEIDQLFKIFSVMGAPNSSEWNEGVQQASNLGIRFPSCSPVSLAELIPSASIDAIDLIQKLLIFNPTHRLTAAEALQHRWFSGFIPTYTEGKSKFASNSNISVRIGSNLNSDRQNEKDNFDFGYGQSLLDELTSGKQPTFQTFIGDREIENDDSGKLSDNSSNNNSNKNMDKLNDNMGSKDRLVDAYNDQLKENSRLNDQQKGKYNQRSQPELKHKENRRVQSAKQLINNFTFQLTEDEDDDFFNFIQNDNIISPVNKVGNKSQSPHSQSPSQLSQQSQLSLQSKLSNQQNNSNQQQQQSNPQLTTSPMMNLLPQVPSNQQNPLRISSPSSTSMSSPSSTSISCAK
ncbi:MAG: putative Serine/threonine-protein kinase MAK, partial [Streblomastix strix]